MTKIKNDRQLGLKIGYEATDWSKPILFEDYINLLEDWNVFTIERDNVPIGAIYKKNDEIHVSVLKQWRGRWLTKSLYFELFTGKRVTTKVQPGYEYIYCILNRIGFRHTINGIMEKG